MFKLAALQHDANEILKNLVTLQKSEASISGAINWADLHATAYQVTDVSGDIWYRVEIEEADPSAEELRDEVRAALLDRGWPETLEIVTEW